MPTTVEYITQFPQEWTDLAVKMGIDTTENPYRGVVLTNSHGLEGVEIETTTTYGSKTENPSFCLALVGPINNLHLDQGIYMASSVSQHEIVQHENLVDELSSGLRNYFRTKNPDIEYTFTLRPERSDEKFTIFSLVKIQTPEAA